MRIALDNLPADTDLLQQLVRDLAGALDEGQAEIDRLRLIIRQFQRAQFGRRSEQTDPDQLAFGLEELEADLARAEARRPAPATSSSDTAAPAKPPHRAPLPAHLPRVETVIPAPHDACPECGGVLNDAGVTSSEMLDWVPASIRVVRITRPKCACRACGTLHQAPAPERVLAGGLATPGLIAHVLVSRYCDHLPLCRQSQIFARHGLEISRSTLSGWVGAACWWLEALHERVVAHVMAGERVFADDTPLPVLDPGRGKTKTGRLWAYTRDDRLFGGNTPPAVVFIYAPDRKGARPAEHLRQFRGILQVDGYAGFEALAEGGAITLAACWAHTIRTQSGLSGWRRPWLWRGIAQRDDMLDLQMVVMDGDALDHQLQQCLAVGNAGTLQAYADAFAERRQAVQHVLGMDLLLAQTAVLFKLLLSKTTLLRQALAAFGQLGQADHLGLVGFQKAAVGTVDPVQSCAQLLAGRLLAGLRDVGFGDEPLELRR